MKKLPQLLLLLLSLPLTAQEVKLQIHSAFFRGQSKVYQSWLENTRLDQAFRVEDTELSITGEQLILNLRFNSRDGQKLTSSWLAVKKAFEAKRSISLEEALFLKMLQLFELPAKAAFVQIDHLGGTGLISAEKHYIRIFSSGEHLNVARHLFNGPVAEPSSKQKLILRSIPHWMTTLEPIDSVTNNNTFDRIRKFMEQRYSEQDSCRGEVPAIEFLHYGEDRLLVSISGQCRRIWSDQEDQLFCNIFRADDPKCEESQQVKLYFSFAVEESGPDRQLSYQLEGTYRKMTEGFRGQVLNMNVRSEFEQLLPMHGEHFLRDLKAWMKVR